MSSVENNAKDQANDYIKSLGIDVEKLVTDLIQLPELATGLAGIVKKSLIPLFERVSSLENDVHELRMENNRLQQYDRRTNLRFFGIKEGASGESTDQIIIQLAKDIGVDISQHDISVSHRRERQKNEQNTKPRGIIVRFVHYRMDIRTEIRYLSTVNKLANGGLELYKYTCDKIDPNLVKINERHRAEELRVLILNTNSILAKIAPDDKASSLTKFDLLQSYMLSNKPIAVAVWETWLSPSTSDNVLTISGYQVPFRKDRPSHAGGVMVYVRNGIKVVRHHNLEDPVAETCFLTLHLPAGKSILFGACYKSKLQIDTDVFTDHLSDVLQKVRLDSKLPHDSIALVGDFNAHYMQQSAFHLNEDLQRVFIWSVLWDLPLNILKYVCMVFGNCALPPPLLINGAQLTYVEKHVHLGLMLTSHLNWAPHIDSIVARCAPFIGSMKFLSYVWLDPDYLRELIPQCKPRYATRNQNKIPAIRK
ncbi:unnamed protein product, partial [Didymodactylos carnosus]